MNRALRDIENRWMFCEGVAGVVKGEDGYGSMGEIGARGVVLERVGAVPAEY